MSNEFTRSYVDEKGNSLKTSSYRLDRCLITNVEGLQKDIRNFIAFMRIHESVFAPSLVLEMGIRDDANFLEEFGISGNEVIDLEIVVKALNVERELLLRFFVTEYKDYARSEKDTQVQAYVLTAVSEHAYIAPLKTISKKISGKSTEEIKTILRDDLNLEYCVQNGECLSIFNGTINISNPLKAATEILKASFDSDNTPYFLYQDLSGQVNLNSLSYLTDLGPDNENVYKVFTNKSQIESTPGTEEEFFERSTQMGKLTSKIGLAPTYQAKKGVFASENRYIDLATKTYRKHTFDQSLQIKSQHTTSKKIGAFDTQAIADKRKSEEASPLNRIPAASIQYHYVNRDAFDGPKNVNEVLEEQEHISRSYISAYDACSHKFTVMGDTFLNPGRICTLLFPKATAPETYQEYSGKSITDIYDTVLSGNYMIFSTVHNFIEGIYETDLVMKTDSLKQELEL